MSPKDNNNSSILMLLARTSEQAVHDMRVMKEAKSLARAGFRVDILLFGGQDVKKEIFPNISFIEKSVNSKKMRGSFLFLTKRFKRAMILKRVLAKKKYVVVHCHDFLMLETAIWGRAHRHSSIIYDSHELFLGSMAFRKNGQWLKKLVFKYLEKFYTKRVKAIISVSEGIKRILAEYGAPKNIVIRNIPDWEPVKLNELNKIDQRQDNKICLIYQGLLTKERGLDILFGCMKRLPNNYELIFLGKRSEDLLKQFSVFGTRVRFLGLLPHREMRRYLMGADLGIYPIQPVCQSYVLSLPNKLFEALLSGLPVIVSDLPEMRKIVKKYEIGDLASAESVDAFCERIVGAVEGNFIDTWRRNCIKVATYYLNWRFEEVKLLNLYDWLAA